MSAARSSTSATTSISLSSTGSRNPLSWRRPAHRTEATSSGPRSRAEAVTPSGRATPLLDLHRDLGARLVDFAGWEMPLQYEGVIAEHNAVRNSAGVFDVSHLGKLRVGGRGAAGPPPAGPPPRRGLGGRAGGKIPPPG